MRRVALLLLAGGLLAVALTRGQQGAASQLDPAQMSEIDRRLDAAVRGR